MKWQSNKKTQKNNKTIFIDLVFCIATLVIMLLDFYKIVNLNLGIPVIADIILILLPGIVTIVSIVLSLTKVGNLQMMK